ncbi:hypothetical protein CU098_009338 [Rhizopus stolonifer]|uniref:AMP-dependent synthetase/ligase domain-containing protein n=1 Tax=Rhizopus stolonifer TaxID=4846 RepID=A0A367KJU6_RHIST|nr:hypothetical protein CU098_009338 [Rhizopus stolonifer]
MFKENTYEYTNLVDAVLSNPRHIPEHKPMYIDSATDETITFGEFKILIRQTTAGLIKFGLKKGDCVSVFSPNHIHVPAFMLSTHAAGAHVSPSNPILSVQDYEKQLRLSKAKFILAHPISLKVALLAATAVGIPHAHVWSILPDDQHRAAYWKDKLCTQEKEEADPIPLTAQESRDTLTYICFSSGTTGPPKGVQISHQNFIANTIELDNTLKKSSTYNNTGALLAIVPFFHIMGIFRFIHMAIYDGRTTVVVAKYDVEHMCHMIDKHQVSSLYVVPPMLLHMLNNPSIADKYKYSSVEAVHVGAAPVSLSLAQNFQKKFNIPVLGGYGMTETASILAIQTIENYAPGSVGHMIGGIDTKVIDEDGQALPIGSTGEICIKGPIVMLGYIDNPEATAESIDSEGYLHTGDIGYVDKLGNWYIVDRSKELIKYNAFQIAPAELEDVLLKCPLVADAAVIGIYDEKNMTEVPLAYITLNEAYKTQDKATIKQAIHAFVNERVVYYKKLRGGIEFIDLVPKNVSGKILRKDLREMYKNSKQKAKL